MCVCVCVCVCVVCVCVCVVIYRQERSFLISSFIALNTKHLIKI